MDPTTEQSLSMYSLSREVSKSSSSLDKPIPSATTPHQKAVENLQKVESSLRSCLKRHRNGKYGFISKEWGFTTPGGLGDRLGGKFEPWEDKLTKAKDFFWPMEAYESMEQKPYGKVNESLIQKLGLKKEAEQLYGNTPLYEFLMEPPIASVTLVEEDLVDYKQAAKIFLLLGTLTHLCGNSSPDPKTCPLPLWMEDPLRQVAERLEVEPTLTGHFLVQENWIYKSALLFGSVSSSEEIQQRQEDENSIVAMKKRSSRTLMMSHMSNQLTSLADRQKATEELDQLLIETLLKECDVGLRRSRLTIFPDAFVGSQAIDVAVDNEFADTREDAVRIIRDVNTRHKVFRHVTHPDALLMDKHVFYQFYKKWTAQSEASSFDMDPRKAYGQSNPRMLKDREIPLNPSASARVASQDIRSAGLLPTSDALIQSAVAQMKSDGTLSEEATPGYFDMDALSLVKGEKTKAKVKALSFLQDHQTPSMTKSIVVRPSEFPDYVSLQRDMAVIDSLKLVDMHGGNSSSSKRFVASQAITVLLDRDCARSRPEATRLLQRINDNYSIFENQTKRHCSFKDDVRL